MQPQEQQRVIGALLKKPENLLCADCNSKSPCWASLDFGVFVCMNCSGAHRALGQSVTRIKSTKLDTWNKDWVWHMQLNNKIINDYFEASLNPILHKKPTPSSSLNQIKKFVYDKYVKKLFARQNEDDPITNLKNGKPYKSSKSNNDQQSKQIEPIKNITPSSINIRTNKNANLLGNESVNSNKVPSINNDVIRQQVNIFDDIEPLTSKKSHEVQNNLYNHHNTYHKDHYNSFSGKGATHSSTGAVGFDDIFGPHHHNQQQTQDKKVSFDIFNTISNPNLNLHQNISHYTQQSSNQPYGYNQHYPQMNLGGYNNGPGQNFNQGPSHITMNINMNMYSNVMNINLKDSQNSSSNQKPGGFQSITLTPTTKNEVKNKMEDHLTLDINDFKIEKKSPHPAEEKGKSWVDDWK